MSRLAPLPESVLQRAVKAYGLRGYRHEKTEAGYRNSSYVFTSATGQRVNLIVYKSEPKMLERIKRVNALGHFLAEQGLPVRHAYDNRILRLASPAREHYASLYSYLPGATISWEAYTRRHIKLLGWAMGEMHRRLAEYPTAAFPNVADEYLEVLHRMQLYFERSEVAAALRDKLFYTLDYAVFASLQKFLKACRGLVGSQVLHMDFVRGNLLFAASHPEDHFRLDGTSLRGIIDFEKAAQGHPLFDIARTLAFLLIDCSGKSEAQIRRYFLQSGYIKRGQNAVKPISVNGSNEVKYDILETAMQLFWLYDFYKHLRQNPYESLPQNYHFRRTVAMLKSRKVVH